MGNLLKESFSKTRAEEVAQKPNLKGLSITEMSARYMTIHYCGFSVNEMNPFFRSSPATSIYLIKQQLNNAKKNTINQATRIAFLEAAIPVLAKMPEPDFDQDFEDGKAPFSHIQKETHFAAQEVMA